MQKWWQSYRANFGLHNGLQSSGSTHNTPTPRLPRVPAGCDVGPARNAPAAEHHVARSLSAAWDGCPTVAAARSNSAML